MAETLSLRQLLQQAKSMAITTGTSELPENTRSGSGRSEKPSDGGRPNSPYRHGDQQPDTCICGGLGWYSIRCDCDPPFNCRDFGQVFPCVCTMAAFAGTLRERLLEDCGILPRFRTKTMNTFDAGYGPDSAMMKAAAARFLTGECKPWLVIAGASDAGKSHIATAITLGLCAQHVAARYESADGFLDKMRDSETGVIHPDEDTHIPASHRMAQYTRASVLILDDIRPDQITTAFPLKLLLNLIDHRYRSGAPTVFTTNCLRDEFDERIGRRLFDEHDLADVLIVRSNKVAQRRAA